MNIKRRLFDAIIIVASIAPIWASAAEQYEPHSNIMQAAEQHVLDQADQLGGKISVDISPPDRRLRLAACDQALQTYDSPNGLRAGRSVVGVRCEGSKPWKLYVSVTIAALRNVVITQRPLVRGQLIASQDLGISEQDTAGLHRGYFVDPTRLIGLTVKRNMQGNTVLTPSMVERSKVIKRGTEVEILADTGSLQVRMKGKALSDGAAGERIRIKNLRSGRTVSGTVIGPGQVRVQP